MQITLSSLSGTFCQGPRRPRPTQQPEAEGPSGIIQSHLNLNKHQHHPEALVKRCAGPHPKASESVGQRGPEILLF